WALLDRANVGPGPTAAKPGAKQETQFSGHTSCSVTLHTGPLRVSALLVVRALLQALAEVEISATKQDRRAAAEPIRTRARRSAAVKLASTRSPGSVYLVSCPNLFVWLESAKSAPVATGSASRS